MDDTFIIYLFELIEELSNDANDPYHYPIIRVLVRSNNITTEVINLLTHFLVSAQ